MATDPLYQLYEEHYATLENGFGLVRDFYQAPNLAAAGIEKFDREGFRKHFKSLPLRFQRNWLAHMLRGQQQRWAEIAPELQRLLGDTQLLREPFENSTRHRAAG